MKILTMLATIGMLFSGGGLCPAAEEVVERYRYAEISLRKRGNSNGGWKRTIR
jgi:hypothetical protein